MTQDQVMYLILSVVGSINAYFVRGMLQSLNQVKMQTAVLIEKNDAKEVRLSKTEKEIDKLREKYHEMNTLVHQLKSIKLIEETD